LLLRRTIGEISVTLRKSIAPFVLLLLVGSILPAVASAEIRTGTGTDPVGDSLGQPSQDLVSASAQYDTNGQAFVTATMNGVIAGGPESFLLFQVASFTPPSGCVGVTLSMAGTTTGSFNIVNVTGVSGTGSSSSVISDRSITFAGGGTALANRGWSCLQVSVAGAGGTPNLDHMDVPVWFTGFGPDSDGDGIVDNQDMCPGVVGVAPTGCPAAIPTPPVTPPVIVQSPTAAAPSATAASVPSAPSTSTQLNSRHCVVPKLAGQTLEASKKELVTADCKLGNVTKKKSASTKKGRVVSQGDRPGALLPEGAAVTVTVGKG
jgi:PASTA domain